MTSRVSPAPSGCAPAFHRPRVGGKFIFVGEEKLYIRGVTYGPFRRDERGNEYRVDRVMRDFARMAAGGVNAVRTYNVPPRWLLDEAARQGLGVMVGIPWEEHVAFLDDRECARSVVSRIRAGVRSCAGHPAVLCYAVGNEIPASIVRWYGRHRIENYLKQLYEAAKNVDPEGLVTYVNFPTTEYLELAFVDFVCFNVYLESQERLEAYLARLQNIAADRPLVLAELGMDSSRHGEKAQAGALRWQIRTAFGSGCAGVFVFSWTDEWHRGGCDVLDWRFGLTDTDRRSKPALLSTQEAFSQVPLPIDPACPRISVIVCTYNGGRTIRDCLEGLRDLKYPDFEVIVVDDGSTDATALIVQEYGFRLIRTENRGLGSARNTGLEAATGEIVAYIDDDARPDPHWLAYLASAFRRSSHAGVGGPNISHPGDGTIADCVANAPGNPVHVLLSDHEAEHIPGCNMAFRKDALKAIGGFDVRFRVAGDDVDVCWRLKERGWTLGFSPAAMVWHHRRNSLRAYWKQQQGYGQAEGVLEKKWPEKYNAAGHLTWSGRVYAKGISQIFGWRRGKIYQGTWGKALFQSVYDPPPDGIWLLAMMPEWYLIVFGLSLVSMLGLLWKPMFLAFPLALLAAAVQLIQAASRAARACFPRQSTQSGIRILGLYGLTTFLHLAQPLARLFGHLRAGLTPWRRRGVRGFAAPLPRRFSVWSVRWQSTEEWLQNLEGALRQQRALVIRGGDYDRWDLEVRDGTLGEVRLRMAIEEHGAGKQLIRFLCWPKCSVEGVILILALAALSIVSALDQAIAACAILGTLAAVLAGALLRDCAAATMAVARTMSGDAGALVNIPMWKPPETELSKGQYSLAKQ